MERVTFVVERTGERIPCLLNPEFLEVRRAAGVTRRRSAGGSIIGNPRTDDPLVATGGGTTDYEFKLLFDVDLFATPASAGAVPGAAAPSATAPASASAADGSAPVSALTEAAEGSPAPAPGDTAKTDPQGSASLAPTVAQSQPPASVDVRTLTQPLWALAENGSPVSGNLAPQRVRFVWGRSWNVPGVILAVAERLECFDPQGVPKRSWLSLRMRRVEEEQEAANAPAPPTSPQFELNPAHSSDGASDDSVVVPVDHDGTPLTPFPVIAAQCCGDPRLYRLLLEYNGIDNPFELGEGQSILVPPPSAIVGMA